MAIGLKRGIVELYDHNPQWETIAARTIKQLWGIFGETAKDIQHIGSTAIRHIKAKPIIDIAVAVDDFGIVEEIMPVLVKNGWSKSELHAIDGDMLIVDDDEEADMRTHHIHIVITGSLQWFNYIYFRDYLNSNITAAKKYESAKQQLAQKYHDDRNAYTDGKDEIVDEILLQARKLMEGTF